jgi:hypothetical protein
VKAGGIVCVFGGEQNNFSHFSSTKAFAFGKANGQHIRNLGTMITHGHPNVAPLEISEVEGFSSIYVFVALEPLKNRDKLCFHHGFTHESLSILNRRLERKEVFARYLNRQVIKDMCWFTKNEISHSNLSAQEFFKVKGIHNRLTYLFQDPIAFATMLEIKKKDETFLTFLEHLLEDWSFIHFVGLDGHKDYVLALKLVIPHVKEGTSSLEKLLNLLHIASERTKQRSKY